MLTNSKTKWGDHSVESLGIPDTNKSPHSPTFLHGTQWVLTRKSRGMAGKRPKRALCKWYREQNPTCFSEASLGKAKPDTGRGAGNSSIPSKKTASVKSNWCWKGQNSFPPPLTLASPYYPTLRQKSTSG